MSFLFPQFLWGLFAVSIPVIIHLFHFRRYKTIYFSNTELLQNLQKENRTKSKLKHYLMLLARILMIVTLVLAFAQPFIPSSQKTDDNGRRRVVIYLDNSFSMEGETENGKMMDFARQLAYDIVGSYQADMQFMILTNDFLPEHQRFMNSNDVKEQISDVQTSSFFRTIPQVLTKINSLAKNGDVFNVYLITDMQSSVMKDNIKLTDYKHNVFLIPVSGNSVSNLSVDSCWFENPVKVFGKTETINAKIKNYSNQSYVDIPIKLFINDTLKSVSSLNIASGETQNVSMNFTHTSRGNIKGLISIDDYPVVFDNNLYFSFTIAKTVKILSIYENSNQKYLKALFDTEADNVSFTETKSGNEKNSEFHNYQVIFANGLKAIPSGLAASFKQYIESGHTLVLIPGNQCDLASYNAFLSSVSFGSVADAVKAKNKVGNLNYNNYLFRDVFGKKEHNPDLPDYNVFMPLKAFSNSGVDVAITDEKSNPLIAVKSIGSGKLVFCAIPLSAENESFMKHPLFVPIFYNIALFSGSSQKPYFITGQESFFDIEYLSKDYSVFHIKDSSSDFIPKHSVIPGGVRVTIPEAIIRSGHYSVEADGFIEAVIALNYSRNESVPDHLTSEEINAELKKIGVNNITIINADKESFKTSVVEQSLGKMLWKYFIILALIFIAFEIAIARLMK